MTDITKKHVLIDNPQKTEQEIDLDQECQPSIQFGSIVDIIEGDDETTIVSDINGTTGEVDTQALISVESLNQYLAQARLELINGCYFHKGEGVAFPVAIQALTYSLIRSKFDGVELASTLIYEQTTYRPFNSRHALYLRQKPISEYAEEPVANVTSDYSISPVGEGLYVLDTQFFDAFTSDLEELASALASGSANFKIGEINFSVNIHTDSTYRSFKFARGDQVLLYQRDGIELPEGYTPTLSVEMSLDHEANGAETAVLVTKHLMLLERSQTL